MNRQNSKNHPEHFWSGFAMGMASGAAILYLVGTKKGRGLLESILEYNKQMEDGKLNISSLLSDLSDQVSSRADTQNSGSNHPQNDTKLNGLVSMLKKIKRH
ncbi:hypothetical protein A3D00_01525 [Candidatus Woesebacteria bacterium RIFCSPHIGHO2_02_FULL_38_9]|uniref:Uncharacterized protein n=1 Tax=Candidatus Roizmanbacteria bacterium RIFCSPLOWO2_01_FULL_41_22 TaxID=1802067 RepID=A0A1F7JAH8_9BACT|nr:MAG: hypothetical protein A2966_02280 [Candidatus Roizmanbacteria bacterium RIFCSPLOWO2_01_FULL_41_22]OGM32120.1 MAG: hypothetical protein A3D00_01525 [Candidatus Woesebacteria bacterium RIFCSPHIGHO2_02_FULL_38_9]